MRTLSIIMFVEKEFRLLPLEKKSIQKPKHSQNIHFLIIIVVSVLLPWIVQRRPWMIVLHVIQIVRWPWRKGKNNFPVCQLRSIKKITSYKTCMHRLPCWFRCRQCSAQRKNWSGQLFNCHKDAAVKHLIHSPILKSKTSAPELVASCKQCHGTHKYSAYEIRTTEWSTESVDICATCHEQQAATLSPFGAWQGVERRSYWCACCMSCHRSQITD